MSEPFKVGELVTWAKPGGGSTHKPLRVLDSSKGFSTVTVDVNGKDGPDTVLVPNAQLVRIHKEQ